MMKMSFGMMIMASLFWACGSGGVEEDAGVDAADGYVLPDGNDPGGFDPGGYDAGADDAGGGGDDGQQGNLNLTGVWAQRLCQNEHYKTTLGETDGTRVSIVRVEVTHTGLQIAERTRVCGIRVPKMSIIQVIFPDTLIDSIPEIQTNKTLDKNDVGALFRSGNNPVIQLIAWHPTGDPATEQLPQSLPDDRVYDQDGDGKPAATALIDAGVLGEGEIYVVARAVQSVDGVVLSESEIGGNVQATSEQVTLDASNPLFKTSAQITQMTGSTFKRVRLGANQICDDIIANEESLFGGLCPTYP